MILRIRRLTFVLILFSFAFVKGLVLTLHAVPKNAPSVGLSVRPEPASPLVLTQERENAFAFFHNYLPGTSRRFSSSIQLEFDFESLDSFIALRGTILGDDLLLPYLLTFDQYTRLMHRVGAARSWHNYVMQNFAEGDGTASGTGGINLDIPVKIRSKAFRKIFGSGTVGLTVTGDIRMQAKLHREDRSEVRTALTRGATTNFNMQQVQRFQVTGKIGDKVTVNVDQDSERAFDFENNVRLQYQGYDDEIIQRIEAGNISLSLPGTRYVTFSGKSSGLFGIKTEMAFGNLNLTAIASQEKGQSQRLSLTGGASEVPRRVKDYQYLQNVYFFLDNIYRENYRHFDRQGNHIAIAEQLQVMQDSIEVYKAAAGYDVKFPDRSIRGWAIFNYPENGVITKEDTAKVVQGEVEFMHFIRLERNEYFVENTLGYIRMNNQLSDDEILAVAYRRNDGTKIGTEVNGTLILKLIKPRNPQPSDATWDLAWKNVYSLGSKNVDLDGLQVKLYFDPPSGSDLETDENGTKWLTLFGLDNKDQNGTPGVPDGEIDRDVNIIDRVHGEIHFPDLQPFDPVGYFVEGDSVNRVPGDKRAPEIYNSTIQAEITAASKFYLDIKTTSRSTEYDLGFNVIEGSEIVTLDGQPLTRGVDYTIDYFSGRLVILNERATNPAARLDVTYERNQLFQLEKKTILGLRAEYNLGKDSFLGSTLLYQNQNTLDRKVRVGRGPMRNLVWDINTRLKFQPNFIGDALDFLPFIRAKGETSLNFEGEVAQVLPTPNTLNNAKTGDKSGVAYIDDFEGSKKTVNLGILRRNWTRASQPADGIHTVKNMGNYIWYNPVGQVPIKEIYPEREVNPNVPQSTHVLTFQLFPDSSKTQVNRWGGIMRALSPGFFDQSETRFIEVMVQGDRGRLHIDLGSISEDVIPNNRLDTEDRVIRNDLLDPGEDIGIDGVAKPDPPTLDFPRDRFVGQTIDQVPYDFWDIDGDGVKDADEPWSFDDWFYVELTNQYITEGTGSINGYENSANDEGGRIPDTEDINRNSIMDPTNSYFSYAFSLDKNSKDVDLIVGGNPDAGWNLYRIPFTRESADTIVGSPSVTQIEYIRMWLDDVDDIDETVTISLAEVNLVGNEWKELGITPNEYQLNSGLDTQQKEKFEISVINTHENPAYAASLAEIGVQGEEDRITGVRAREQSLILKSTQLDTGFAGVAFKSFFQGEDYIRYNRIKMFVYGVDSTLSGDFIPNDEVSESKVEYFVRFGADINNYYEYRSRVYAGWDKRNHMDVALQDFTRIDRTDSSSFDFRTQTFVKYLNEDSTKSIRVKGSPSLTNVRTLMLGIRNVNHENGEPFTGEVWFNELRLSDIQKDKGMAFRVRGNMRIADFASVNAEVERVDADFHNVSKRFGDGDNRLSSSVSASINLDKVLPQSLGISMPLNLTYRNSSSTPKYFPGQDRLVTGDLSGEVLDAIRKESNQTGFNVSFRRQAKSKNFFIKNTVDKMSFSLGRSMRKASSPTLKFSNNRTWSGNFDYRIDFGRNNYIKFLSWLPGLPLLRKIKDTKLYYTPQNVSFKLNGTKNDQISQNRITNTAQQAPINKTEAFTFDRSVRTNMKLFESLNLDFSRTNRADMKDKKFADFFKGNFEDINIVQTFTARYNPRIFTWLNNTFTYASNYTFNNNIQQKTTGRSARVTSTRSADFVFQWKKLVASLFGDKKKRSTPGRRTPGRRIPGREPGNKEGVNKLSLFQKKKDKRGGISVNPIKAIRTFFSSFKDINFNYTERRNITHLGLDAGKPSLAFQFGLSDTTGVGTVPDLASNDISFTDSKTYNVGSGVALGRAVDIGLRFQHSDQRSETTTITGSSSNTWLRLGKFDMPFPEWNVRVSGLQKLPIFSTLFNSVSFSHSFNGQKDVTWNGTPDNEIQVNFITNFRPLGKLDLNFKNGFTGSVQVNRSQSLSRSRNLGIGARRTTKSDLSITANYSKRSGFRIPFWPFNKAELKNSIDFSFTFTASKDVVEQRRTQISGEEKFEEQDRTTRFSFSPRLTYSFSNRVRGGAFIEFGTTDSKRVGKTSIQEFGIDINISIRGN